MLLKRFLEIVGEWDSVFCQARTTRRAVRQALGALICLGRRTLTRIVYAIGNEQNNHSSEYFLHSRSHWSVDELFAPIVKRAVSFVRGDLIGVVVDDTSLKKTGKRIQQAFWSRDPMSPHFNVNLRLGIRFLQFCIVLPLHAAHAAARTVPIVFEEVSAVKKPRKNRKDYQEKIQEYRKLVKIHNLSIRAAAAAAKVRTMLDVAGMFKKTLVIIGDGSFCNRRIFSRIAERTDLLLRCRKDLQLCRKSESTRRFYAEQRFTPLAVLLDPTVVWQQVSIFFGGKRRTLRYKEISNIFWPTGAKKRPLRLFVIDGIHYRVRKTGKLYRRDPGFLLTTMTQGCTKQLLHLYFDRWQIEVNHREEKTTLGVGQAQLHNYQAVPKQPALVVAAYSALLMAGLIAYGPHRTEIYEPLPRWRANAKRPSCLDLATLLRKQTVENQQIQDELGMRVTYQRLATVAAA